MVVQPKIVTLTMNPALDITTGAELVRPTDKIRCAGVRYDPGGGGINVARVAHMLGEPVLAVYPAGGPTGGLVTELLAGAGVPLHRIAIAAATRESFTVDEHSTGKQYRFVLPGPQLTPAEQTECLEALRLAAVSADYVVASGSLPPGVAPDFYQRVSDICRDSGARLVLDTSGGGLTHVRSGVFLLKPSLRELRECTGAPLESTADQFAAAGELIERGIAEAVVVSMGADGALLATPGAYRRYLAPPVEPGSGVGAGDAMVAAMVVGLSRQWSLSHSVRFGIAAGAAMLSTPGTSVCLRADVERLLDQIPEPAPISALLARRSPVT
ncbi:MAG: 1-phosphofructokinase family hexose kinase [Mycobacterium sp.]|nr:1-phosphofructokinase family hexose kinase [Mycobacterium sp.]